MHTQDKINQLINSKTAANNCLAMLLMLNTQKMSFEEAFGRLELLEEKKNNIYSINIATLRICYTVTFHMAIDVPADWGQINRKIILEGKLVENGEKELPDIEEGIAWSIDNGYEEMDFYDIDKDLIAIVPLVKKLFYELII